MDYKIKVYDIWEFGQRVDKQGNPHQEDSLYPAYGKATDADRLFILCDGMGGHDDGEVASSTVCEEMSAAVNASLAKGEPFSRAVFDAALDAGFKGLDAKDHNPESKKKMGTTMTFLMLSPSGAFVAHMGDSRVYHIRPGKDGKTSEKLHKTYDHSLVNDLVRIGELTEEEAKKSPRKNVITRAMQPHLERRPRADVYACADVRPGDYFYMCSDGMLEQMEDDRILEIFSEAGGDDRAKVETLKKETAGNQDNHTAFIVHVLDVVGDSAPKASNGMPSSTASGESAPAAVPKAEAMPKPKQNAPLTAKMAYKRSAKSNRGRLIMLIISAIVAIAAVLLWFFAFKN